MTSSGITDWFGRRLPFAPEMSLQVSDDRLLFRFRAGKAPVCDDHPLGEFVEGLWQKDVAELFLAGEGPAYQEINISPTGAWWSALFSSYRRLDREVRFEPRLEVERQNDAWSVTFSCSTDCIVPWRGLPPAGRRASITAILYTPEPHYFAWSHQGGGEPDFHREDLFVHL